VDDVCPCILSGCSPHYYQRYSSFLIFAAICATFEYYSSKISGIAAAKFNAEAAEGEQIPMGFKKLLSGTKKQFIKIVIPWALKQLLKKVESKIPPKICQAMLECYPGITIEELKRGWIPIPATAIETALNSYLEKSKDFPKVGLKCCPNYFLIETFKSTIGCKHRIQAKLTCKEFTLNKNKAMAVFECQDNLDVDGQNFLGTLTSWLAKIIVLQMLKNREKSEQLENETLGAVKLDWPAITVLLDKIDPIKKMLDKQFLGYSLTNFVNFSELQIEQDFVRIRIKISNGT